MSVTSSTSDPSGARLSPTPSSPALSGGVTPRVHTLSNGVRVVCDPVQGLESLALTAVIDAGARDERPDQGGWAHLLEHMVFKGAGGRSAREIVEAIEGEGGHINAATGQERTSFQVRCLKGGLPLAMSVISDLILRPALDESDLEREKDVVAQEIAEAADAPDDRVFELAQGEAFRGHALGRPILGAHETLAGASASSLGAFHRGHFSADRIIVSAAGALDEDELLALADTFFGGAAAGATPKMAGERPIFAGGHARETRRLEQAHLVLLLPAVSRHDPDYFALTLFTEMLGGGMSSRLFQEVREKRGLAYAIDAYQESYEDAGVLGIYAGARGQDAAETARLTAQTLKALTVSVGEGELARAKAQLKGSLFMRRESPLARAEANANNVHSFGRLFPAAELAGRIDGVGAEDIRRIGERIMGAHQTASAVLGAKTAAKAGPLFAEALAAG